MGIELTLNFMDETKSYGYIEYEAKYQIIFGFSTLKEIFQQQDMEDTVLPNRLLWRR